MLNDSERGRALFRRLDRRRMLQVGTLGALGLNLPQLLRANDSTGAAKSSATAVTKENKESGTRENQKKAKSCILFFMEGGPSHVDLWDMKPDAPENVRGPFKPIDTSLPGMQVCEHLPNWARVMDRMCVVRSVSHTIVDHNASSYYTLTGQSPMRDGQLIRRPSRENAPPIGSVLAKFKPTDSPLPGYVHLPKRMINCGSFIPGVLSGFLGDAYDPFVGGDPSVDDYRVPGLQQRIAGDRFARRRTLQEQIDHSLDAAGENIALGRMQTFYEKAYSLITSPQARKAFDLSDEPRALRERYGLRKPIEGHRGGGLPHLGQSLLLARRLVESGVRLVTVWAGGQAFDGHRNLYPTLKDALCPPTDRAFAALIDDLDERGMLDETLVVAIAEFGRTPKLGQITSSAGANAEGRDHWPRCYTAFFAGAGIKAGSIYGRSDALAAYPHENPVSPGDLTATIYTLMGLDPETRIYDRFDRPYSLAHGWPVDELLS